jgi:hypothetical protein
MILLCKKPVANSWFSLTFCTEKCIFTCWFTATHPIWRPVLPLNLTYILIFLSQLSWVNVPYKLLIFHVPNLMSIFLRLGHLSKASIQVHGHFWHFVTSLFFKARSCKPHAQPPSWRTTPWQLSTTAYSIYSQLPFISGGRLLHLQPEDVPCCGDKWPT